MTLHVREIGRLRRDARRRLEIGDKGFECDGFLAVQLRTNLKQVSCRQDVGAVDQTGLGGIATGQNQRSARIAGFDGDRQGADDRPQFAAQRQLANALHRRQRFTTDLPRGGEDAERDGQVEAAAFLGNVGRRHVDGDALGGEFEVAIEQGAAHAVLAFLHGGFGQAHDGEVRQAVGDMNFHRDQRGCDALPSPRVDDGEAHAVTRPGARASETAFPTRRSGLRALRVSPGSGPAPRAARRTPRD